MGMLTEHLLVSLFDMNYPGGHDTVGDVGCEVGVHYQFVGVSNHGGGDAT